jgi:hypothetical protein
MYCVRTSGFSCLLSTALYTCAVRQGRGGLCGPGELKPQPQPFRPHQSAANITRQPVCCKCARRPHLEGPAAKPSPPPPPASTSPLAFNSLILTSVTTPPRPDKLAAAPPGGNDALQRPPPPQLPAFPPPPHLGEQFGELVDLAVRLAARAQLRRCLLHRVAAVHEGHHLRRWGGCVGGVGDVGVWVAWVCGSGGCVGDVGGLGVGVSRVGAQDE